MSSVAWQISGDCFETCSCDYLCPCAPSNLAAQPTKGHCDVGSEHGQALGEEAEVLFLLSRGCAPHGNLGVQRRQRMPNEMGCMRSIAGGNKSDSNTSPTHLACLRPEGLGPAQRFAN
jgi:hypothetical protein